MIGARSARCRSAVIAGIVALTLTTTACASTAYLTVVPLRGQESAQIERDRDECEADAVRYRDRAVFFKTKVVRQGLCHPVCRPGVVGRRGSAATGGWIRLRRRGGRARSRCRSARPGP